MKKFKFALKNSILIVVLFSIFIACEQDFVSIDSDVINEGTATNFNTTSESFEVITYNDALGPVETNNLGVNLLGVYDDPGYGRTTANILTQLTPESFSPDFGNNAVLDSVVINIPFFSRNTGFNENGIPEFVLDSILPRNQDNSFSAISLSIFESNFFLRDFNPSNGFNSSQAYFSNQSASISEPINDIDLEGFLIHREDTLVISNQEIILTNGDTENIIVTENLEPQIRLAFRSDVQDDMNVINYWRQKILNQENNSTLSNSNNFNNFFRGLYLKAETLNNEDSGSLIILNLAINNSNITLHYTRDALTDGQREQRTFTLTYGQNRVNFFKNEFTRPLIDGDDVNGDSRLFIKGGEGSIAKIKLFNGENTDDDDNTDNSFEAWRKQFVNLNEGGAFESSKRLVNEANLVFYVDSMMTNGQEPNRLYLYDADNNIPLADYFIDLASGITDPNFAISNHLGILERVNDEPNGQGIRYRMRITSHINNLLIQDSTNVTLGLAVSSDVNLEASIQQRSQQLINETINNIPASSIISPRGTILHGSNSEDPSRRVFLEIFYTCLNTDDDCEENN